MSDGATDERTTRERADASGSSATPTIDVVVNGDERAVPEGSTITDLLRSLDLEPGTVVVERNREIVDRARHDRVRLDAGDRLELVHFVGGG